MYGLLLIYYKPHFETWFFGFLDYKYKYIINNKNRIIIYIYIYIYIYIDSPINQLINYKITRFKRECYM